MIQGMQIFKANFVNEEITSKQPYRIFMLEKGFGVIKVDEIEIDFRMGRIYIIPEKSVLKINGYIASGFLLTIDEYHLDNFEANGYFISKKTKVIDLCWTELRLIFKGIKELGKEFIVPKTASIMKLFALLGINEYQVK